MMHDYDGKISNPPASMGEGVAWFALQHGGNRSARSLVEHSQSVTVRANRALKPAQPVPTLRDAYFWRSKSKRAKSSAQ
ncbi:MAG: hypothetical protein GVY20_07040 [Bacteroidetes bacterium]|nr:hypothetical protein [Bacteroidota bacterium]